MTVPITDLDRWDTWPAGMLDELQYWLPTVLAEKARDAEFMASENHSILPTPPMPVTKAILEMIDERMLERRIRVLHATRLLDFDEVRKHGLRPLNLAERIERLQGLLSSLRLDSAAREFEAYVHTVDLSKLDFAYRVDQVWFTPLRRHLHAGGCDGFFDYWGGEAIRSMAVGSPALQAALSVIGSPAVVIANIPAFGCCSRGDLHLATTMLDLAIEGGAGVEPTRMIGWDVCVRQPVPAGWIERVAGIDDADLA